MSVLWAVMGVENKGQVRFLPGSIINLDLQWADGMVGCVPVFATEEAAIKYSAGKVDVMCFQIGGE